MIMPYDQERGTRTVRLDQMTSEFLKRMREM